MSFSKNSQFPVDTILVDTMPIHGYQHVDAAKVVMVPVRRGGRRGMGGFWDKD
jgi:hypothetical protein